METPKYQGSFTAERLQRLAEGANDPAWPKSVIGSRQYIELSVCLSFCLFVTVCKGSKPESKMRSSQFHQQGGADVDIVFSF